MGPKAAALMAEVIDRLEGRPHGTGRLPSPTLKVVEALRFFVREGVQWQWWRQTCTPATKLTRPHRVLMVGYGLNDRAALASAYMSMASTFEASRAAADFFFIRELLDVIVMAQDVALGAVRPVRQNFGLAVLYKCIAIPLAAAGLVTPLVVAFAMLTSSILAVADALRLNRGLLAPQIDLRLRAALMAVTP